MGSAAVFFPEAAGEMGQRTEPGFKCDFGNGHGTGPQKIFCVCQPHIPQVLPKGNAHLVTETEIKVIGGIAGIGGSVAYADWFVEMCMEVA